MTGMRIAQTRGGKKFWRGWSESTKGWQERERRETLAGAPLGERGSMGGGQSGRRKRWYAYHEQSPEGVVEKDNRGSQEHGDAHNFVKLRDRERFGG